VILVMIIAQPRIFMIMGRDGLLPPVFAKIHRSTHAAHQHRDHGLGIAAPRRRCFRSTCSAISSRWAR
jgi:APA family basic amino acid/polyamine antiporter